MSSGRSWARQYTSGQLTGKDFTASDVDGLPPALPNWVEFVTAGTLTATDADGGALVFSSVAAGKRYNISLRSITTCTADLRLGYSVNGVPPASGQGDPGPNWTVTPNKTTSYTAVLGEFVKADTSLGAITITLPTAVGGSGQRIAIKDAGGAATATPIVVATTSAQTVDGAAAATIATNKAVRVYVSDGANWYVG